MYEVRGEVNEKRGRVGREGGVNCKWGEVKC